MKSDDREVVESPQYQGADEEIIYSLTTTPWASTPTSVLTKIFLVTGTTYTDYSTTCLGPTTATVSGDVITLPIVKSLTQGSIYRLEVKFVSGGNTYEPYMIINGQR